MKKIFFAISILAIGVSCSQHSTQKTSEANKNLAALFNQYYEERLQIFPLEATANGDTRYNNLLPAEFTDSYREKLKNFFTRYQDSIARFDTATLSENDKISYNIFMHEMNMGLQGLSLNFVPSPALQSEKYIPFNQFWGLPLTMGQLGSGDGNQPFKTVEDYDKWLQRAYAFSVWTDSAIAYFKKGIEANYVLPKTLVVKMIPQLDAMVVSKPNQSLFYGPINKMPVDFSDTTKQRLEKAFIAVISNQLTPSYKKLSTFLKTDYLPKARSTTGISAVPNGPAYYDYLVKYWTTTNKSPEEIYNTGLSEVKRIRGLMDSVKDAVGFKGDLNAFFDYMRNDKKFMPYKTPEEVLNAFRAIQNTIEPNLKTMFGRVPKTKFEIRQTEAFRAASASAEYNQGSADGSRPGVFYVPIVDATKFNTTSGMESLFLHEAIPGHHYQISLQQENESLPKFRRFSWYGAYGEGWALYCESLGKELGLYKDPYQYMGALGDEIHRAIRLVVDVPMHTKNMTREEAIKYMMDNEAISEDGATAEIERYMAIPAQALSYKIGALKIREMRNKYKNELGNKFSLSDFHDEYLKDGCMPLEIVEKKMDAWAQAQKR